MDSLETWMEAVSSNEVLAVVNDLDGHTIWDTETLVAKGLPVNVASSFTKKHLSGPSPKEMLFVNGEPVPYIEGIYGLDLLYAISNVLDLPFSQSLGRGSRAAFYKDEIKKWAASNG